MSMVYISSELSAALGECTNWSTAVTVPATCKLCVAIIGIGMRNAGDDDVTAATLGGIALTARLQTSTWRTEIWDINNPPTGAQNFAGTKASTEYTYFTLYYFANGAYSHGGTDTVTAATTTVSGLSAVAGDYILEGVLGNSNVRTYSAASGQTEDCESDIFASKFMCYRLSVVGATASVAVNADGVIGMGHTAAVYHAGGGNQAIWL